VRIRHQHTGIETIARNLLRAGLVGGVSTLALAASIGHAQTAPAGGSGEDVVVVTGVRGSLQRSMNIKRNATGVVESITSEDIGKYPDTNLAESVQRIPGVSIDRTNGEGSKVTVRGFGPGFNLVTLNGRVMPTASIDVVGTANAFAGGGSRNFDFSNIAADGVSGFDVYKTGKADIASGGIGATLNIKTLRPIGKAGMTGSFSVKGLHGENVVDGKEWTPQVTGAYSWTNSDKTFGVALFGEYVERDAASRQATQNNWNLDTYAQFFAPSSGRLRYAANQTTLLTQITGDVPVAGSQIAYPNDSRYLLSQTHNKKTNLVGTVQWRPVENWLFTADAVYVKNEATENQAQQGNWFNRPFDQIKFQKGASGIYNAIYLQENENGVKDEGFENQIISQKNELKSFGLNAVWNISNNATLTLDAHSSEGKSTPNNSNGSTSTLLSIAAPVIAAHSVSFTGEIPVQTDVINDALRGNNNGKLDVGDLGTQVGRTVINSQTHKIDEFKAAYAYENENSRLEFGTDLIKSSMETKTGNTYQALGDWGISHPGDIATYAPGLVTTYDLASLFQDFNPGTVPTTAFRFNAIDVYNKLVKSPLYNTSIPIASLTANTIEEKIYALYTQATLKGDFLSKPTTLVAGLRYEHTDVNASALQSIPTAIRWTADNDFTVDFGSGVATVSGKSHYSNFLPNIDFSVELRDDLKARASFSKTISRAAFGNLYATTSVGGPPRPTINGTNPTASSGNPALLPLESSNVDVSVEWYYAKSSYVSLGLYNKDINNFVGTGKVNTTQFGLRDPTSGATGSRSGTAAAALASISQSTTDVNLFTMTALLIKNAGNVTAAKTEYQSHQDVNGNLTQAFVDSTLAAYDITADANDPLFTFNTSIPVNNKTANIHGIELAFQHFFGDSGFGASGSYTTVNGDIGFDNSAPTGTTQFPLLGLSNTYNLTGIYDKGKLSGRIAYNWRDKYIASSNNGAQADPIYVEPFGTVDASVNYQVAPNIQITFEGLNLNKEHIRQYGRDTTNVYFAMELDTRYQVGVRYKF
jgi:TonB-dependent receptor